MPVCEWIRMRMRGWTTPFNHTMHLTPLRASLCITLKHHNVYWHYGVHFLYTPHSMSHPSPHINHIRASSLCSQSLKKCISEVTRTSVHRAVDRLLIPGDFNKQACVLHASHFIALSSMSSLPSLPSLPSIYWQFHVPTNSNYKCMFTYGNIHSLIQQISHSHYGHLNHPHYWSKHVWNLIKTAVFTSFFQFFLLIMHRFSFLLPNMIAYVCIPLRLCPPPCPVNNAISMSVVKYTIIRCATSFIYIRTIA